MSKPWVRYTSDQVKKGYWSWVWGGSVYHFFIQGRTLCGKTGLVQHRARDIGRPMRECPWCKKRMERLCDG